MRWTDFVKRRSTHPTRIYPPLRDGGLEVGAGSAACLAAGGAIGGADAAGAAGVGLSLATLRESPDADFCAAVSAMRKMNTAACRSLRRSASITSGGR